MRPSTDKMKCLLHVVIFSVIVLTAMAVSSSFVSGNHGGAHMDAGVTLSSISGIPTEMAWGNQYQRTPFSVFIKVNTFDTDQGGVVPLVFMDQTTCAALSAQGFSLFMSNGTTFLQVETMTEVSSPTRCQFSPSSSVFGQIVVAKSTANAWSFEFQFGPEDVAGQSYSFRAQFAKDV